MKYDIISGTIDSGLPYDITSYDFSKAFDKVPLERDYFKISQHMISKVTCWTGYVFG